MPEFYYLDLSPEFINELRETLADMVNPVRVDVFTGPNCETCDDTVKLLRAMSEASPVRGGRRMLEVRFYDYTRRGDLEEFRRQGVDRVPAVTLLDGTIKYLGIPAGEEIRGLVETIMRISEGESGLEEATKRELKRLQGSVKIEIIVTPACPYCPYAALLANMFAYESYKAGSASIVSEIVEAYENTDIAEKYRVMSVPTVVVNGHVVFVGVPYEEDFLEYVKAAAEGKLHGHHHAHHY